MDNHKECESKDNLERRSQRDYQNERSREFEGATDERARDEENSKREKLTNVDLPEVPEWKFERPKRKPPGSKSPDEAKSYSALGLGLTLAFGLVVPIVLGVAVGAWIDSRFGVSYGTMVGFVVGAVLSFMLMLRIVKRMNP